MKKILSIIIILLVCTFTRAANVTFPVTNSLGQPDNTPIKIIPLVPQVLPWVLQTKSPPFYIYPTNGFCVISNMQSGIYLATNSTLTASPFWPFGGSSSGGYMFTVDNTTNTYSFSSVPYPVNNAGGVPVFNWYLGINGVYLTNGFSGGITNGVLYLNGANFTATITSNSIVIGLGYIPANVNSIWTNTVPTNGPSIVIGQTLFLQTPDTNGAAIYQGGLNTNLSFMLSLQGTNNTTLVSNILAAATAAVQANLISSNGIFQGQLTDTTNALALLIQAEHGFAINISNLWFNGSNNFMGYIGAVSNANQNLALTIGANGTNNLNNSNILYQQQFTTRGNNDTNNAALQALNATNVLATELIAWSIANFDPINAAKNATNLLGTAAYMNRLAVVTNITAGASSTNLLGTTSTGAQVGVPWSALPAGGGGGSGPYAPTNSDVAFGNITSTNGGKISGNAVGVTNINPNQIALVLTTNGTASSGQTNLPAFDSTGAERFWNLLALPYDLAGVASNLVDGMTNLVTAVTSNALATTIGNIGNNGTNWGNQISNSITGDPRFNTSTTNKQPVANFGAVNLPGWLDFTNADGTYIRSNTLTGRIQATTSAANGASATFADTNGTFIASNFIAFANGLFNALVASNGAVLNGQVFFSNLTNAGGFSMSIQGNSLTMVGGTLNIAGMSQFVANLNGCTNLGGTGASITGITGMFSGGGNGGANALTNLIFTLTSTNSTAFTIGQNGTNNLNASNLVYQLQFTTTSNGLMGVIQAYGLQGTNNLNASNLLWEAQLTTTTNGLQSQINALANTNGPTIWNETLHSNEFFGGHPYQWESISVLGVTNFSGNLIPGNGTYIQVSSTLWLDTNNPVYSILTNGASCLIQSNNTTVATAGAVINGAYTITAPGSGNNPGVKIGSIIDETSVLHIGPANFTNLNSVNATILNGAVSNLTVGTLSASVLNASSALTSVHVSVSTNGWGYAGFWTNETSGAQALQDAINSGTNLLQVWTNIFSFTFTTNSCGLDIEIAPGTYYRPQGWTIPNQYAVAGWHIHSQSFPNTYLIGDSNILKNYTNYTGFGGYAGALPFEEVDHLGLVFSNYTQKTFAVDLRGNGYLAYHDNWLISQVSLITSNMANGWIGGDTPGNYLPAGYKPGIICMVDDGQTGDQCIYGVNVFSGGAAGLIGIGEHQRIQDGEWKQMSGISAPFTNLWATNDTTVVLVSDTGVNLFGGEIAVGGSIYVLGSGDTSITGSKFLGGGIGVFVSGIHNGSQYYGPVLLKNLHFENMNRPSMGDVVVANGSDGSTFPSTVITYDCVDQQSADGSMQAWTYDTVSHVVSQNFSDIVAPSYVTSFAVENTAGFQAYLEYRVNNIPVFSINTDNNNGSNIVFNANWPITADTINLTTANNFTSTNGFIRWKINKNLSPYVIPVNAITNGQPLGTEAWGVSNTTPYILVYTNATPFIQLFGNSAGGPLL